MGYQHEWNQEENRRFREACDAAGLSESERDRFSEVYHKLPDRQRMSFGAIRDAAAEWKNDSGGGFRRSDRR